jgi:hypothetical protein
MGHSHEQGPYQVEGLRGCIIGPMCCNTPGVGLAQWELVLPQLR